MEISRVLKNSLAEKLGLKKGDEIVSFNGFDFIDILDYEYYNSFSDFKIKAVVSGKEKEFNILKDESESFGLEFDSEIKVRQCRNKCVFCFVDQLPKSALRNTLRIKDDDYRHSFISGTYITLTNLSKSDIDRIIRLKLSPLYISVHSTNDEIRNKLLGIKEGFSILPLLKEFKANGIDFHSQIVYCPGFNDDLETSINELMPLSLSLSVVPVGLTKECNPSLRPVDAQGARITVELIEKIQEKALKQYGTRFVWPADELYVKAGMTIPHYDTYEAYPQIENGVGLLAKFNEDFEYALKEVKKGKIGKVSIATGESAYGFIKEKAQILNEKFGGEISVYKIHNNFFGASVTVAGLITGGDLYCQLKNKPLNGRLILPSVMLREFTDVFLDDISVKELEEMLKVKITVAEPDGESFVKSVLEG